MEHAGAKRFCINDEMPSDISQDKNSNLARLNYNRSCLKKDIHGKTFSFNWYVSYEWIEYSIEKQAAYCFCCRHFPNSKTTTTWSNSKGFATWNKGKTAADKHSRSEGHVISLVSWRKFLERGDTEIRCQLSSSYAKEVEENHAYMDSLINVVLLLGKQGLAFRGHNEGETF